MTTGPITHDNYKQLPTPDDLPACPCCGSPAELWQYSLDYGAPTTKVVMCGNDTAIIEDKNAVDGEPLCPLYMPPQTFYQATVREAVDFWKRYKHALLNRRIKNTWDAYYKAVNDKTVKVIWPSGN